MSGTTCPPGTTECGPIDCAVSEWGAWSKCDADCGGGFQTRARKVTTLPSHGGNKCPVLEETRECNTDKCVKDICQVSEWSKWSKCSASCGGGVQTRSRKVVSGFLHCPELSESQSCNEHSCKDCAGCRDKTSGPCMHDAAGDFTCFDYFPGTEQCPPGTTACLVKKNNLGLLGGKPGNGKCTDCFGKSSGPCKHDAAPVCHDYMAGTTTCPPGTAPCAPVNCEVSEWSKWSKCSANCGGGSQTRSRSVTVEPTNGGMACPHLEEDQSCNTHKCTPKCNKCTGKSSGPCQHDKDNTCFGYMKGTKATCPPGSHECVVQDCVVSEWGAWTKCDAKCGGGNQYRSRAVLIEPSKGGKQCPALEDSQACNTHNCASCAGCLGKSSGPCMQDNVPICHDYYYGTTDCPAGTTECKVTKKDFTSLDVLPGNGMCDNCFGKSAGPCRHNADNSCHAFIPGTSDCPAGTTPCAPVNCEVSAWSKWSKCSASCGGGSQTRTRKVTVAPRDGGMECPELSESQDCNTHKCAGCVGCAAKTSGPCQHDKASVCYDYYAGTTNCPAGTHDCSQKPLGTFALLGDKAGEPGDGQCRGCFGKSSGPCQHDKDTSCFDFMAGTTTCPPGTHQCAVVNCEVSEWGAWSKCDAKCGGGSQTRSRKVTVEPQNGGMKCPSLTDEQDCNTHACEPVCTACVGKSSGPCQQIKDGTCHGYMKGTKATCPPGTIECAVPVDCEVSERSKWGACSEKCGGGSQTRTRAITVAAANGGKECPVLSEDQACNKQKCDFCSACVGKSSGPCQNTANGVCYDYYKGTTLCPAGTVSCVNKNLNVAAVTLLDAPKGDGMCP